VRRRARSPRLALWVVLVLAAVPAACGADSTRHGQLQRRPSPILHLRGGAPAHIAVVVMENEEYGDIIGSRATPYINRLAERYGLARAMYATTHPSLPNYLALTGGSTFGIDSDCTDCSVHAAGLIDQLQAAGISWRAYMEDLPHPCFRGAGNGGYAKKHDPFLYYTDVAGRPARCDRVVPLTRLSADERDRALPRFLWITPNLCHDMHDCDPATGDRFLSQLLPALLAALGRHGLLVLTWDEGSSDEGCCRLSSGGHIATILAGPGARRGARLSTPVDQYSILQGIEDLLGLPRLRGAACACTPSLAPLLVSPTRSRSAVRTG
jgi:phosphatidylinositol-3-phosphatase